MLYIKRCLCILLLILTITPIRCGDDPVNRLLQTPKEQWIKEFGAKSGGKISRCCAILQKASGNSLDLVYIKTVSDKGNLQANAYKILDEAMAGERMLDEADKLAGEITKTDGSARLKEAFFAPRESLGRSLRCRMRTIVAIARASVAQSMANPVSRSYCSQAMESSIDALRDAIKYCDDKTYASALTSLRTRLLDIWDTSQKTADVGPVKEMDLPGLLRECGVLSVQCGKSSGSTPKDP